MLTKQTLLINAEITSACSLNRYKDLGIIVDEKLYFIPNIEYLTFKVLKLLDFHVYRYS